MIKFILLVLLFFAWSSNKTEIDARLVKCTNFRVYFSEIRMLIIVRRSHSATLEYTCNVSSINSSSKNFIFDLLFGEWGTLSIVHYLQYIGNILLPYEKEGKTTELNHTENI
jgi:hypothetical protein